MPAFPDLTSLRNRKAELERNVQIARYRVEMVRQQLRSQASDSASRAAIAATLATARVTLDSEIQKLAASVAALNHERAAIVSANIHPIFTPQRPVPALLFPIRIETVFTELPGNRFVLRVRLYPDMVAIETHERELTADEVVHAKRYVQDMASPKAETRADG